MTKTTKKTTPGFAIEIGETTELRMGMLIAEDAAGKYQPIGVVSSISEAREIAANDFRHRDGTGFCPASYRVWADGIDGFLPVKTLGVR